MPERGRNNVISPVTASRIIGVAGGIPVFGKGGVAKAGEKEWRRAVAAGAGAAGIETEERVMSVKQKVLAFLREEEGLTTVEYAIGGGLVGLAVVLAFTDLGEAVADVIRDIIGAISG